VSINISEADAHIYSSTSRSKQTSQDRA